MENVPTLFILSFLPMGHAVSCALANLHLFTIHFSFLRACQDRGQLHGGLICCCIDLAKAGGENLQTRP